VRVKTKDVVTLSVAFKRYFCGKYCRAMWLALYCSHFRSVYYDDAETADTEKEWLWNKMCCCCCCCRL